MKTFRMGIHRLDANKNVVPVADDDRRGRVVAWDIKNRQVAKTEVAGKRVSTVFLVIDHGSHGEPLFFETMVFGEGSWVEEYVERYGTWDEAEAGHKRAVEMVAKAAPS